MELKFGLLFVYLIMLIVNLFLNNSNFATNLIFIGLTIVVLSFYDLLKLLANKSVNQQINNELLLITAVVFLIPIHSYFSPLIGSYLKLGVVVSLFLVLLYLHLFKDNVQISEYVNFHISLFALIILFLCLYIKYEIRVNNENVLGQDKSSYYVEISKAGENKVRVVPAKVNEEIFVTGTYDEPTMLGSISHDAEESVFTIEEVYIQNLTLMFSGCTASYEKVTVCEDSNGTSWHLKLTNAK